MQSLIHYAINEEYAKVERLGDRLADIEPLIDWEAFRSIIADMFDNRSEKGGRPNIDEVVMIKALVIQQWYGLSDPELERQATDRILFRKFLWFPDVIPDKSTIWTFRERLKEAGKERDME
jgi:IS5 family transposase